ncbi:hypothetical protein Ddc_20923 [Ditylenchus destructor]|nr:hypothetical protein Ddc_20923 [Ditylenchus destructor]
MNYMLLVNVLEYFNRDDLEKLSIVSQLFEKVVRLEFPQHPFRVFQELHIVTGTNGGIDLKMDNDGLELKRTLATKIPELRYLLPCGAWMDVDMKYLPLRAMLPFMAKSVRFKETIIEVNSTLISQQSITAMENFAHLWTGRILEIRHGFDIITPTSPNYQRFEAYVEDKPYKCFAPNEAIMPSCDRIFNAPGVIAPCRELRLYGIDTPLSVLPVLYGLKIIRITEARGFSASNLLDFVEGLAKYNSTTLLICSSNVNFQITHIEKIQEAFSKAKVALAWRLIIWDEEFGTEKLIKFRDENLLTKEVLELRLTDSKMRKDIWNISGDMDYYRLWILERKPL